jgi:hypothetical protein
MVTLQKHLDEGGMATSGIRLPPGEVFVPGMIDLIKLDAPSNAMPDGDGDAIQWAAEPPPRRHGEPLKASMTFVQPTPDLLAAFCELFSAAPGKILVFARENGVLGLTDQSEIPEQPNRARGIELLDVWRTKASEVRSILRLAALLYSGESIRPQDIAGGAICSQGNHRPQIMSPRLSKEGLCYVCANCLFVLTPAEVYGPISNRAAVSLRTYPKDAEAIKIGEYRPPEFFWNDPETGKSKPFPSEKEKRRGIARQWLDRTLQDWLHDYPSAIAIQRQKNVLGAALEYRRDLLSVIALQLMQAVARQFVYLCSECREPFIRRGGSETERKPRTDRGQFCDSCKEAGAIDKRADGRRREKKTRARDLYARGLDAVTIAEKLDLRNGAATVQNWAKKGKWNDQTKTR